MLHSIFMISRALKNILRFLLFLLAVFLCLTCAKPEAASPLPEREAMTGSADLAEAIARFSWDGTADLDREAFIEDFWRWIFGEARVPETLARKVASSAIESPAFVLELLQVLQQDPYTYYLVDKGHALPDAYAPHDLVPLRGELSYRVTREGLSLRQMAAESLEAMAAAAKGAGVTLIVGSSYRSADYQAQVYAREVAAYGQETADRESAQPGKSQHQTGLVVDFSPIDDAFAKTAASAWLQKNASLFGWSLSFPNDYEDVTGYRGESWHYRYVGPDLSAFIDKYFDGIQQYALQFILAWRERSGE
jgi:D-alanyl-D-alanine carboxypeptidase